MPEEDKKFSLLVVDDEAGIREGLAYEFEDEGFEVFLAQGGYEALDIIRKNDIDFVISDMRMPEGDGVYLLDKLSEEFPGKPMVFLISGYSDICEEVVVKKGAHALYSKPQDFEKLLDDLKMFRQRVRDQ